MDVTIYGVRGSIPVPGPTTVRYGGNTVCVSARLADGTLLFLDAGTGLRQLGKDILAQPEPEPVHFLLSHLHYDHIIGLPFFEPLFTPRFDLVVHPVFTPGEGLHRPHEAIFDGVKTPVPLKSLPCRIHWDDAATATWTVGSARVSRIQLNHPGGSLGYRIDDADGGSLTYLTDNELFPPGPQTATPDSLIAFAKNTGLLIADAQYMPIDLPEKAGWGHSTVPQALRLGREAAPGTLALFHHDPDRTDEMLDHIGAQAQEFGQAEMMRGPVVVAAEGMRFRLLAGGCERLTDRVDR